MQVLADTSVWVAHFRKPNSALISLLEQDRLLMHPHVLLELACGTPPAPRQSTLMLLGQLQQAPSATPQELLTFTQQNRLFDQGCGMVDVSLLAATRMVAGAFLWTLDKPLAALAKRLGCAFNPAK